MVNYSLPLEGKAIRWISFNPVEFSGSRCGRVGGVRGCSVLQERQVGPRWAGKRRGPGQRLGRARTHLGTTAGNPGLPQLSPQPAMCTHGASKTSLGLATPWAKLG